MVTKMLFTVLIITDHLILVSSDPCGATLQSGSINIAKSLTTALTQGGGSLPSLSANGSITMTIHQVNADGGGPYSAMVNLDATGKTWVAATVTQQVPGANGIVRYVSISL